MQCISVTETKHQYKLNYHEGEVKSLAKNHDSQRRLLTHLVAIETMTEDLSLAAERGDLNACSLLLRQGAGVNDVDSSGDIFRRYSEYFKMLFAALYTLN